MRTLRKTALSFSDPRTGAPSPKVFRDTMVLSSHAGFGSGNVTVETGLSEAFDADDVVIRGHLLALNLGDTAVVIETRDGGRCERERLAPGAIFVRSAGTRLRQRNHGTLHWAAVEIPVATAEILLGGAVSVEPACGLVDESLAQIVRAMVAEAACDCPTGSLYADALCGALAARLAHRVGTAPTTSRRGGFDAARLARIRELVDAQLATNLTVADLAAAAGLSPAHFAREFRRVTGETPHAFVIGRRLERARRLLAAGRRPGDVAAATGFADPVHLSRVFRSRFGVTPGKFRMVCASAVPFKSRRSDVQDGEDGDGNPR